MIEQVYTNIHRNISKEMKYVEWRVWNGGCGMGSVEWKVNGR